MKNKKIKFVIYIAPTSKPVEGGNYCQPRKTEYMQWKRDVYEHKWKSFRGILAVTYEYYAGFGIVELASNGRFIDSWKARLILGFPPESLYRVDLGLSKVGCLQEDP